MAMHRLITAATLCGLLAGCQAPTDDGTESTEDGVGRPAGGPAGDTEGDAGRENNRSGGSGRPVDGSTSEADPDAYRLTSSAFQNEGAIPIRYTCEGANDAPPLSWSGVPEGTKTMALIMDDPDVPEGAWDHWVWWDLPADTSGLREGQSPADLGATMGRNSFDSDNERYRGPCPPRGDEAHHYHFRLYALDTELDLIGGSSSDDLRAAMEGHQLGVTTLNGTYQRQAIG